jgi:hypothetical protein
MRPDGGTALEEMMSVLRSRRTMMAMDDWKTPRSVLAKVGSSITFHSHNLEFASDT